ncbi:MAG: phospholipid/cholesterol/gamma-HCH transport system substrate-binding protein [Bryobacterales bacterium]|jgi:phospholipid/cholesterol/gamma-HCH transport system substrate-binding protein|nr:phospholipid/cholesterol/gamma-HCH transport system substrate-binding protein [Bryobacterales bacterium]
MAELEIKPTVGSRVRVAAVILAAICISGSLIFLLSGGGPDSFSSKAVITTYMPDATGLAPNSEVRRNGIRIGHVTKLDISNSMDPQRAVRVDMKIIARFLKTIPQDSQTSIGADTLIGYKFVDIAAGKSPLLLADHGVLPSEPLQQAGNRADLIRRLQTELRQADELLIQISSGNTKIGQFVLGDKEYNDFLKQASAFEKAMRSFTSSGSVAGAALFTNDMYQQFRAPLLRVDASLAAVQRGEGAAGRLFASDDQYNQFVKSLQGFRAVLADANAGKGRFGPLLRDEAAYNRVRTMLASTDAMLRSLQVGEGNLGQLLKNPLLYESLNGSLRGVQTLLEDLRTNPKKYLRYQVF